MRRFLHIFSYVIVMLVIILVVMVFGVNLVGISTYNYNEGSIIYVMHKDPSDINTGDTITFKLDDNGNIATSTVYRIDRTQRYFYIKASDFAYTEDNTHNAGNGAYDNGEVPIEFDALIGKTIITIPYIGYCTKFISVKERAFIVVIVLIIAFILIWFTTKESKKHKEPLTETEESVDEITEAGQTVDTSENAENHGDTESTESIENTGSSEYKENAENTKSTETSEPAADTDNTDKDSPAVQENNRQ